MEVVAGVLLPALVMGTPPPSAIHLLSGRPSSLSGAHAAGKHGFRRGSVLERCTAGNQSRSTHGFLATGFMLKTWCRECAHAACKTFAMDDVEGTARVTSDPEPIIMEAIDLRPVNCINSVEREDSPILEYPLHASAKVVTGFGRGSKQMGIPTANLDPEELPKEVRELPKGVYFGWVQVRGEGLDAGVHKMVMNIGNRPTFADSDATTVEVHILHDYEGDFYGKDAAIVVLGFIRPEMKFSSLDALVTRIGEDIKIARSSLEEEVQKSYQTDRFFRL